MATPLHDDDAANPAARAAAERLRGPLSVVLTLATAAVAVLCIHLDASGIQYVQADDYRPQTAPTAALEFAPLTDAIELQPASAPARTNEFF